MEKEIIKVLEKIRPYIQRDGGDVEFVRVDQDGVVTVRMLGACMDCMALDTTLKEGIEANLIEEVVGVKAVILDIF
jgi:Fe-S cluster biogenesis protein NfuA